MSLFRKNIGSRGEKLACEYLKSKGYRIITRNYRKKIGEIDIIAKDGQELIFVEVKTRSDHSWGSPCEAVTRGKQQRIIAACQLYLLEHEIVESAIRFDIIAIIFPENSPPTIDHIIGAFEDSSPFSL